MFGRSLLILAVAVLAAPRPLPGQAPDRFAPIKATIKRFLDSTNTASVAVAVAKDGKIIWEEGFGWANREKMVPATQHTMYSLASISKPITATGVMVLVDRGRIDLDKPINDYLGIGKLAGQAGDASGATVRRVLSHTAGLPLHYQFFYADKGYGPPSMDETIARYANLVWAPGTVYEYSNLGFGILDYLISRVSGQSYPDFMRNEVFLPLGLTRTSIDIGPGLEPYAAERYDVRQRPIPFYTFDHNGGSAVYSSAHDLVRFGIFHSRTRLADQRQILEPETNEAMKQPVAQANYGLGWAVGLSGGYLRWTHGGGMPGVATTLAIFPTENLVVVVLANSGSRPESIAADIAGLFLPRYADSMAAARARPPQTPPPFAPGAALVGQWAGTVKTWQRTVPIRLEIRDNGDVFASLGEQPRAVVNQLTFVNNRLTGRFAGQIGTDDAGRWPHSLQLGLQLVEGALKGQLSAQTGTDPLYYSLASYAELKRQ
jgi:CubicO group peptidase (beta-lactamase class C family)